MAIPDASSTWSSVGTFGFGGWACWAAAIAGTASAAAIESDRTDLRIRISLEVGLNCDACLASPVPADLLFKFNGLKFHRRASKPQAPRLGARNLVDRPNLVQRPNATLRG